MDMNIDRVPDEEADTNLSNYDASLVPEGALVVHFGSCGNKVIITCNGQVVKREDLEIPASFYLVNKYFVQDIPRYISNDTEPYNYQAYLRGMGYYQEEIDRVIEISTGVNIKGD